MSLDKDYFEDTINSLEGIYKEVEVMKNSLLEIPLQQFEIFFEEDKNGNPVYKSLEEKEKKELINTLKNDILPLFEESDYQPGIEKANSYVTLFGEGLEL
jgi:hypothetical protein